MRGTDRTWGRASEEVNLYPEHVLRRGVPATPRLARPDLVARALPRPVTLVEAPGGYGKTTLAALVAESMDRVTIRVVAERGVPLAASAEAGLRAAGLRAWANAADDPGRLLAALSGTGQQLLVVIDELQRSDDDGQHWCVRLLDEAGPEVAVLLAGRRLGRPIAAWADGHDLRPLGVDELAFDSEEVARLLGDDGAAEAVAIRSATQGWPAAVALAVSGAGLAPTSGTDVVGALVTRLLAELPAAQAQTVCAVGSLPLLSAHIASTRAGPGALDTLLDAGIPVRFREDGWGVVADPVRAALDPYVQPDVERLRRVAIEYARGGEALTGAVLLARTGDQTGVAALLAGATRAQLTTLGLPAVGALLTAIDDATLAPYAAVLADAALCADGLDPVRRQEWLARGLRIATEPVTRRALLAEHARDLQRALNLDEAQQVAAHVLGEVGANERRTRGRALLVDGLCRLVREQAAATTQTLDCFERAIAELALADEPALEAEALRCSASGVHHNAGRFAVAVTQLERAVSLLPAADLLRARELPYLADALRELGRLDRAETYLEEAWSLGRRLAIEQTAGYAAWSRALLAADRRDADGVEEWVAAALAHRGTWYDAGAGIDFLAHVAEMRLLVGDLAGADDALDQARARVGDGDYQWPVLSVRARREAVHGDPTVALEILTRLEGLGVGRDRPIVLALRAVALHRSGDPTAARQVLDQAARACRALDDPTRLERREPELLAILGTRVERPVRRRVDVLGGLRVFVDERDVTPPPGLPRRLVAVLALASPRPVEEVVGLLWPDADTETGRSRLRNLLNRVRASGADVVVRRGDTLALADDVDVDLERLRRAADTVTAAAPEVRPGLARAALAASPSFELLPEERYEAWCEPQRGWVRRRGLALLDLLAADALGRGDLDDAAALLEQALTLEPDDRDRLRALATVLRRQGRSRTAAELERRADATPE